MNVFLDLMHPPMPLVPKDSLSLVGNIRLNPRGHASKVILGTIAVDMARIFQARILQAKLLQRRKNKNKHSF